MVSFGHAMYIGIGAYAVGILSFHGVGNGWVQLARRRLSSALSSRCSSASVCLRTSGVAFIMITLAFAQMFYFLAITPEAVRRRRRA